MGKTPQGTKTDALSALSSILHPTRPLKRRQMNEPKSTKIRIHNFTAHWDDGRTILSGMMCSPVQALIQIPLVGFAKRKADHWIDQIVIKNTDFQMPIVIDVLTDESNYACDLEIPDIPKPLQGNRADGVTDVISTDNEIV